MILKNLLKIIITFELHAHKCCLVLKQHRPVSKDNRYENYYIKKKKIIKFFFLKFKFIKNYYYICVGYTHTHKCGSVLK